MKPILAIDPGTTESAYVVWDGERIVGHAKEANRAMMGILGHWYDQGITQLVIEWLTGYGLKVGSETFETCFWVGRFCQAWPGAVARLPRREVKLHLCENSTAKDQHVRQALIDRLGEPGTKKAPGPTYGLAGDEWAALGVAVTWWDRLERAKARCEAAR